MKTIGIRILVTAALAGAPALPAFAQTPASITTPDRLETRLGTLEFKDGAPSKATVEKVYDNLDFMHASEIFLNAFRGASLVAARKGFVSAGAEDNSIIIFCAIPGRATRAIRLRPQSRAPTAPPLCISARPNRQA